MQMGLQAQQAGQLMRAEAAYQHVLAHEPRYADALHLLGLVALQTNRPQEAEILLQRALKAAPKTALFHENLARVYLAQGKREEAIQAYHTALKLNPNSVAACNDLSVLRLEDGNAKEAATMARRALRLDGRYVAAHYNLGNALLATARVEEAIQAYEQALQQCPTYAEAYHARGNARGRLGDWAAAAQDYRTALSLRPGYADAHNNLGQALTALGQWDEASVSFQAALDLYPTAVTPPRAQAHLNLALVHLVQGDWPRGFAEYEWRWQSGQQTLPNWPQPRWQGEPLHGRTLLLCEEQGLGDMMQFIRYADLLKAQGATVLVRCQPTLQRLFARLTSVDGVLTPEAPLPPFDCYAPLMSLPHLCGTTVETIPQAIPYLSVAPELIAHWQKQLPQQTMNVGICWQGNPKHQRDRQRSIPLDCFAPLAACDHTQFISLQKGLRHEQLPTSHTDLRNRITVLAEMNEPESDFMDTAAVMMKLDLIITADTSAAHLAGALGRPVWLALSYSSDWRWLLDRGDTPWYPTMRLFRQQQPDDWAEVFGRLKTALQAETARNINAHPTAK